MYLLVAAVSFAPGNIPLPTRFQYIDPLQIVAPTFSGLSALLAASTFAEAKKQGTSTMINPGRHPRTESREQVSKRRYWRWSTLSMAEAIRNRNLLIDRRVSGPHCQTEE